MRNAIAQRQRTKENPLDLGSFSATSLRYLKGSLGPKSKVVGYKDTALSLAVAMAVEHIIIGSKSTY